MITADSLPIAILYEYLWQKSLPFGKSKIPLVNKLINPLVRVIPQKKILEEEKNMTNKKLMKKIAPVVMSAAVAMTSMPYAVLASDFTVRYLQTAQISLFPKSLPPRMRRKNLPPKMSRMLLLQKHSREKLMCL